MTYYASNVTLTLYPAH